MRRRRASAVPPRYQSIEVTGSEADTRIDKLASMLPKKPPGRPSHLRLRSSLRSPATSGVGGSMSSTPGAIARGMSEVEALSPTRLPGIAGSPGRTAPTMNASRGRPSGFYSDPHTNLNAVSKHRGKVSTSVDFRSSVLPSPSVAAVEKGCSFDAPKPIFTPETLDEGRISSVDVKVMVPYDTGPDQVPRAVEVERKRRMYASVDIEALLLDFGIDYSLPGVLGGPGSPPPLDPSIPTSHLPLEAFDNSDFDAREPHEWVDSAMKDKDGVVCVPCAVLNIDEEDKTGHWVSAKMLTFSEEKQQFLVRLVENGEERWLPRIHICFQVEDPFSFAQRVAHAHAFRRSTEAQLRYNLYVDSMPIDEIPPLSSHAVDSIIRKSNAELLISSHDDLGLHTLIEELHLDYNRTANKLIFDNSLRDPAQAELFSGLELPEFEEKPPAPEFGLVEIPPFDLISQVRAFHFSTFLNSPQIIAANYWIMSECEDLRNNSCLFWLQQHKTMRLDEFEQIQIQHINHVHQDLKDGWVTSLKNKIVAQLKDVGKGWLFLRERNRDTYEMSKLKKYMKQLQFLMQDQLRYFVEDSLERYVKYIEYECRLQVEVRSHGNVLVVDPELLKKAQRGRIQLDDYTASNGSVDNQFRIPMFSVDLMEREGELTYSTTPERFRAVLLGVFERALDACRNIPAVEPFVMDQFRWHEKPMLSPVEPDEPLVVGLRTRLQTAVNTALHALEVYPSMFHDWSHILSCTPREYAERFEQEEHSLSEFREEIARQIRIKSAVGETLPHLVNLGICVVDCTNIRNQLTRRTHDTARLIMGVVNKLGRAKSKEAVVRYMEIANKLKVNPRNIEHLTEIREYMKTIPKESAQISIVIREMRQFYDILEAFECPIADDDFKMFWSAVFWPRQIEILAEQAEQALDNARDNFKESMDAEKHIFEKEVDRLGAQVARFNRHTDLDRVQEVAADVKHIRRDLNKCVEQAKLFNNREVLFGEEQTEYLKLQATIKEFEPFYQLWTNADDWLKWKTSWETDPFGELVPEDIEKCVQQVYGVMFKQSRALQQSGQEELANIARNILRQVEEFKPELPLLSSLLNPGMQDRHWQEISEAVGFPVRVGEHIKSLRDIDRLNLRSYLESINVISDKASKEHQLEVALNKMKAEWASVEFEIVPYRKTFVLRGLDDIWQMLDDHIVKTQSMGFSPYKKPHEEAILAWDKLLNRVSELLDEWTKFQQGWMQNEPIFSSDDIMEQLPNEGKKFRTVDRQWIKSMDSAKSNPVVVNFVQSNPRLLEAFLECNKTIDEIQKGLEEYLEKKRQSFARFYFLSNDQLLAILSHTREPRAVQPYMSKCFENVSLLEFEEDNKMVAMISAEGERVPFVHGGIYPKGNVEEWLGAVEGMMKSSVRDQILLATEDYTVTPRKEWVTKWPGQVVLVVSQMFWTQEVEQVFQEGKSMKDYYKLLENQLVGLTEVVRGELSNMERITVGALITIDVHARDVVDRLIKDNVSSVEDFEWVAQLRYYWENDDMWMRQVETRFQYGYEYLGNTSRLVITPLTDRIYLTLTGALHLHLGGAPAGPAGTGKTETVKDLAKALAKQCVVFNCQEGLDYRAMEKFFKGLAMAGAWACFDEFNRIDVEVLSVVAQQISELQRALNAGLARVEFGNTEIRVDPSFAIFITMNPGYAGRTELPDNLKALFRPVACMVPDYALIGEIRMFSFGFTQAQALSRKMVATFRLSSEQLSSQFHYDFGMRAVNTVISAAGLLKRQNPDEDEQLVLLRALRDSNLPKFLTDDIILFNGIISDLFPGTKPPVSDYGMLIESIKNVLADEGLQPVEDFITKCIQLYDMTILRHGLMLVGPTGAGKSTCYRVLQKALTRISHDPRYEKVKTFCCNPKSITMSQLYGGSDPMTHEWTDGIIAVIFRKASEDRTPDKKWVVFDGPVDALWIESMNTVLDENKKLCLVSGETITMSPQMTVMFEVEDLAEASPATVSRCGMIYMEPQNCVGTAAQVKTWLQRLPPAVAKYEHLLQEAIDLFLDDALEFTRKECSEYVPTVMNNRTDSLFRMLDAFFDKYIEREGFETEYPRELADKLADNIHSMFLFSLVWSVGGSIDGGSRPKFDHFLRQKMEESPGNYRVPEGRLIYDFCFREEDGLWTSWMGTIPKFTLDPRTKFEDIIVPTTDTVRYTWMLNHLIPHGMHVLCVGPTGTGKTLVVQDKLMNGFPEELTPLFVSFSAQTSANQTQDILDSKFDKRRKGVFGPPPGRKYVVFVDDVNMPARERYGAQPPIELLRQWMDYGGWYDRKGDLAWRSIVDISFVGAMGPPGGGRNPVTNRFLRHFNFVAFPEMEDESKFTIFNTILDTFVQSQFAKEFHSLSERITSASLRVYNTIVKELLPTPAKSHYTFNLRDLAKVFQGMLMGSPKTLTSPEDMFKLWAHETARVFRDRLIDDDDRAWFDRLRDENMREFFGKGFRDVVASERLIFGDFMIPGADPRIYNEINDMEKIKVVMDDYMEIFNSDTNRPLNLVLFLDAMEHVARIARVLRQPMGNALLLGVGGSGRQSLTRLAAFMSELDVFQIEISKSYGVADWRDNLRTLLKRTGVSGEQVVFLFSDTQIVLESFLEDINNVLNSGEVPTLFDQADLEIIFEAMDRLLRAEGKPVSKITLMNRFARRVRQNLHVVLAFSPVGSAFRNRLRMFPSLVNCCTIDWFSAWPEEALQSVAAAQLDHIRIDEALKASVVEQCVFIHQSVEQISTKYLAELRRHNYVTPTSYLELLSTFRDLLDKQEKTIDQQRQRFEVGLDKLKTTEVDVQQLQNHLIEMKPKLIETQGHVKNLLTQIEKETAEAKATREIVLKDEAEATEKRDVCAAIKAEAESELSVALPALERALVALKDLKTNDIVEVAKYGIPPGMVKDTMEAVCIMFKQKPKMVGEVGSKKPDYWEPARALLRNANKMKEDMLQYEKDDIPEDIISKITPYTENPRFVAEEVAKSSKACAPMCSWVLAMFNYHHTNKKIEPLRAKLAEAEAELSVVEAGLSKTKAQLAEVENKLVEMQLQFEENEAKEKDLQAQVDACTTKLNRAERLIGGLGGEKSRWQIAVQELNIRQKNVVGDVLVSSGAVAYMGPFTAPYRAELNATWQRRMVEFGIPHTDDTNVRKILGDPVSIREWELCGLPSDALSIENAIILSKARRWPLMIDPQGQANKWIKKMEADKGLEVMKLSNKEYLRTLENAVQFGRPVLIENINEEIDPALEPVLQKQIYKRQNQFYIKLGETEVAYNDDFRLYLTTKLRNPHYSPEISVKVTLLNFFITPGGLEDQLLGTLVAKERPELERQKNELVVESAKNRNKLHSLEDDILRMLKESGDDILDDEALINKLQESKVTSDDIKKKVAEAEKTEQAIDETRNSYRPVAFKASLMFFCVSDLAMVDPMYQYSLHWFVRLFSLAIDAAEASNEIDTRLFNLHEYFTYLLYQNVCRSLFEKHKLLFSFMLCIKLLDGYGKIVPEEFRFLLTGATAQAELENPCGEWLNSKSWQEVESLSKLSGFEGLPESFKENSDAWRAYFESQECQSEPLPGGFDESLNLFQKMLVLRCLRPDKVVDNISEFVSHHLGPKFIDHPGFNLPASYSDASNVTPLIFVLSAGADPMADFIGFAEEMRFGKKYESISLGQDQGPKAERMIQNAVENGSWVVLQNCHLAVSWMPELERICENLEDGQVHPNFRLWLTSLPSDKFPVNVLQNGVKMTNEPPKGLRANLRGTYSRFTDKALEHATKPVEFRRLLFGLSCFHAIIQERRKFGPLGWNIRYEFTNGDLMCCVLQMRLLLEQYEEIPYKVLQTLTGQINYGGRVTDDWDRRTLMTILDDFINPDVLKVGYSFNPTSSESIYQTIEAETQREYLDYIQDLPMKADPDIFGLHENADMTCAQAESFELLETYLSLQKGVSSAGAKSREDIIEETTRDILSQLPELFDLEAVAKKYPTLYEESMNTVLSQEAMRYNRLLRVMKRTLPDILKALKGLVVMSEELETVANSLFINQVPKLWADVAYPSLMPLSAWYLDLLARLRYIREWYEHGTPSVFWISGFYFPQAFLTGTLQNYARKHQVSIDTVSFSFIFLREKWEDLKEPPQDGCYIRGLFCEGARWDTEKGHLVESRPKELYTMMPVIWLKPESNRQKPVDGFYTCPVYKTLTRAGTLSTTGHSTNYVVTVEVPSDLPEKHWVKRGVALFCALDFVPS